MPSVPEGLVTETQDWPADAAAIDAARSFLGRTRGQVAAVACDSDVDGLAAAVIVERAVSTLRGVPHVLPAARGEHVHRPSMKARIEATGASSLIVLDMGSRPEPILPGVPTLVVDHHHAAAGSPPGADVVNGYDRPPVAPSSVLAFVICRVVPGVQDCAWLGALGAIADLGSAAAFRGVLGIRSGGARWSRAVALLNAARRAPTPDPGAALDTLRRAASVEDVTSGRLPHAATLERYREQVQAEIDRCSRVPPRIAGQVALVRFASAAQVHPIVATRWSRRVQPRIVVAANDGYLPGRVNFAVRGGSDVDLVAWLRALPFTPPPDAEYANGHARATGGSLPPAAFAAFLEALGFAPAPAGR